MGIFSELSGPRAPGSSAWPGPFASPDSYMDALRNQGVFGSTGECLRWEGACWGVASTTPQPGSAPPLLHPARENQHRGDPALGAEDHGAVHVLPEEPQVRSGARCRDPQGWRKSRGRAEGAKGLILPSPQRLRAEQRMENGSEAPKEKPRRCFQQHGRQTPTCSWHHQHPPSTLGWGPTARLQLGSPSPVPFLTSPPLPRMFPARLAAANTT